MNYPKTYDKFSNHAVWSHFNKNTVIKVLDWISMFLIVVPSLIMALTSPNPPLAGLYMAWVTGSITAGVAGYLRKSSAHMALNFSLLAMNLVGLARLSV